MEATAGESMESELNGYGDTLHFILQFLHSEGFSTTEEVLLQEIEKKLPAVIEQTIQKHGAAHLLEEDAQHLVPGAVGAAGDLDGAPQPSDDPAEFLRQAMLETEDTRRSKSADTSVSTARAAPAPLHKEKPSCYAPAAVAAPVQPSEPASPLSDRSGWSGGSKSRSRRRFHLLPPLVVDGGNLEVDEYDDDEDTGYGAQQIL